MIRLETVEDFEKVKKAFDNLQSKPADYTVRCFGYCSFCKAITEYDGSYNIEGCTEICRRCGNTFGWSGSTKFNSECPYITDWLQVPTDKVEMARLTSREQQKKFFDLALKYFIKKQKSRQKKANSTIRRLAKLRS